MSQNRNFFCNFAALIRHLGHCVIYRHCVIWVIYRYSGNAWNNDDK